ncbi:MAG: ester cyclase [Limisphaerales bacterium]
MAGGFHPLFSFRTPTGGVFPALFYSRKIRPGTHKGKYLNALPTGKRICFKGIEIITIKNGKLIERWGEWDGIDLLCSWARFNLL